MRLCDRSWLHPGMRVTTKKGASSGLAAYTREVGHDANVWTCFDEDICYSTDYHPRLPVAVIKLAFAYASAAGFFEPLTQGDLFPTVRAHLEGSSQRARAPSMVRYL